MKQMLISLGSNVQKEEKIAAAIQALRNRAEMRLCAVSAIYETVPIGHNGLHSDQPTFYNGAALVETSCTRDQVRTILRQIEADLGRVRSDNKFAPRPIDLDVVFVRTRQESADVPTYADPGIERFIHLSAPLAELAPEWALAECGRTLGQIAEQHWAASPHVPKKLEGFLCH